MAALNQSNAVRGALLQILTDELRYPGAGCVDQPFGPQGEAAAVLTLQFDMPDATGALGAQAAGAGMDMCAFFPRGHGVEYNQARVVYPAIGVFEAATDRRLQGAVVAEAQAARSRQLLALAEVVIQEQACADHPRGAQVRAMRQHEAHWFDDMRRLGQQDFALGQRFADQAEFVMFEIAQATVDQFAAGR